MFVARLVALLALFAVACAQKQCANVFIGSTAGRKVPLLDVPMTPGIRDWSLTIPTDACAKVGGYHVGTSVSACDTDSPPKPVLNSLLNGFVHRTGAADFYGVIHTYVYCAQTPFGSDKVGGAQGVNDQAPAPSVSPVEMSVPGYMSRI